MGRGLLPVPLCALLRHAGVGSREQVQPPLPLPRRRSSWGGGRPPGPGGAEGRACGSPAEVGAGGGGGRPLSGLCGRGGGEWGGAFGPLEMPPVGRGGGGMAVCWGVAPFPRPPLPRAGFSHRPSLGPLIPRLLSRGTGRPGVAVRVSGQWLAGCGAAGSPPRSLSPLSLPWEVARPLASCRTVGGGRGSGGPAPPPNSPVPAVWAFTCAAACVGAGAAAAAGCAGGSASGRGRCAKPGGASCWRPHAEHRSPFQEGWPRQLPVGPRRPDH